MFSLPPNYDLAVAIVGATIGAIVGNQFLQLNRNAPIALSITGGIIFYVAAWPLLIVGLVAVFLLAIWYARGITPWLREFGLVVLSHTDRFLGRQFANFYRIAERARDDFIERLSWFDDLPLSEDDVKDIVDDERGRFVESIKSLSSQFNYDNQPRRRRNRSSQASTNRTQRFRDLFFVPVDEDNLGR